MIQLHSSCPICRDLIEEGSNYCQSCGCSLIKCRVCGTLNTGTSKFCQSCGKAIVPQIAIQPISNAINDEKQKPNEMKNVSDQKVYDYLVAHQGKISWSNTSKELDMSLEDLKISVNRLIEDGKIMPQQTSDKQNSETPTKEDSRSISPSQVERLFSNRIRFQPNYPTTYRQLNKTNDSMTFSLTNLIEKLDGKMRIEKICAICRRSFKGTEEQILCLRCAILHPGFKIKFRNR